MLSKSRLYQCAPFIVWVKDTSYILVAHTKRQSHWLMEGEEAIVWDLLTLGYPYERLLVMLALMLDVTKEGAAQIVQEALCDWLEAGIIQEVSISDDRSA